jgi:outer membrane protein assembly factor BamB
VIFDGQAMTVGQSAVYAVDLATGDVAWEVPRSGGALSIPAVVAGAGREPDVLLYLEGPEAAGGATASSSSSPTSSSSASPSPSAHAPGRGSDLVAIDLTDRSELWRTPLGAASRTGVTVEGDAAYVADDAGTVYAVGIADGVVRWSRGLEGEGPCAAFDGGRIDSSVAAADGRVISLARNNDAGSIAVSAYDGAAGDCLWRMVSRTGTAAASAPAAGDGSVIVGLGDRVVRSLSGDGGEQRWGSMALSLFLPVSSPALDSGAVYMVDVGGGLYRLDATDGARSWSYQLNDTVVRSSPVVTGGAVLVGLNDGRLVAVDARSGHLVWESAATPGLIGAIAVGSDAIVAVKGGRDAGLIAFENDPEGSLVDVPSPTQLELGTTLSRFGLAAALALVVVLVPGILARRRFAGAFAEEEVGEDVAEEDE